MKNKFKKIRSWAKKRDLYKKGDVKTQFLKLQEEIGELAEALLNKDEIEIQKQEETEKQILNEELEKKENKKIIENAADKRVYTVFVTISLATFLITIVLLTNS